MNKWLGWLLGIAAGAVLLFGGNYAYGYWVWNKAEPGDPDLSRTIVYEVRPRGIFISQLDGAEKKEITASLNLGPDDFTWLPRFSPDGTEVVFATGRLNRGQQMSWTVRLMVANLSTSEVKELFRDKATATSEYDLPLLADFYASWSLDGKTLTFAVESDSLGEGRTVEVSTGKPVSRPSESTRQKTIFVDQPAAPEEPSPKWIAEETYIKSSEFAQFGENAVYVRPKYSIFKKKILSEFLYANGVWLDDDHIIVDGPRDIIVVDIKGNVKARIPDARHFDLAP